MAYKQIKSFSLSKMGTRRGWCLLNCRLAYGINVGKYPSAKADMEAQKKGGTLHSISSIPTNCAVPVYCDTASKYEHIVIYDRGTVYSDGVKIAGGLSAFKCFGWGELCDGVRVVEWVADAVPASGSFLPAKGYWGFGDNHANVGKIASFMYKTFPAYTKKAALGNYYGANIRAAITEFQRRTGLQADGYVGKLTLAKLVQYGFKY